MEFKSAVERSKENPRQRIVIVLPPQTVKIQRKVLKNHPELKSSSPGDARAGKPGSGILASFRLFAQRGRPKLLAKAEVTFIDWVLIHLICVSGHCFPQ